MTDTATVDALPLDYFAAKCVMLASVRVAGYKDAGKVIGLMTADQRRKLRGDNFMTPERVALVRVGGFVVEVSTGMGLFPDTRICGVTAFRLGGDRDDDWQRELSACVHSVAELDAQLVKIAAA